MKVVDRIIEEAMARGEFTDLAGEGKPLDLSAYFDTPEEVRLAYSILKNANILPREAELLKEIHDLQGKLPLTQDEIKKKELLRQIEGRLLCYRSLTDQRKGST